MARNRALDPVHDGYVLEVTERVTVNHEKSWWASAPVDPNRTRYVVVLPETLSYIWLDITLPGQLERWSIQEYLDDGTVLAVKYYDGKKQNIKTVLSELDEKWYYAKTAALELLEDRWSNPFYLERRWPWSRQHLAGAQKWADDLDPTVTLKLIRDLTGETVAEWNQLLGYINTQYTLEAVRQDNGKVIENRVLYDGETIAIEEGEEISLDELEYTYPLQEEFLFSAVDQAGNEVRVPVLLTIAVPELDIELIDFIDQWAEITTKLSHTIDKGQVKFEVNRMGYREPLDPNTFAVQPLDPRVTWGLYVFDTSIILYDAAGNEIGQVDTQSGELDVSPDTDVSIDFAPNGRGAVEVRGGDSAGGTSDAPVFSVHMQWGWLAPQQGVEVLDPGFERIALESNYVGGFTAWYCLRPRGQSCHIYVSAAGDVFVEAAWISEYTGTYDFIDGYVQYTIMDAL